MGYAGGTKRHPTYESLGDHTESVQIEYDPARISYEDLLRVFWSSHNPDTPPFSRQYMSIIFHHTEDQRRLALASKTREEARQKRKLHTRIVPATAFTPAEPYHQKYYLRSSRTLWQELAAAYPSEADIVASTAAARLNGYLGGHGLARLRDDLPQLGLSPDVARRLLELAQRAPSPQCQ